MTGHRGHNQHLRLGFFQPGTFEVQQITEWQAMTDLFVNTVLFAINSGIAEAEFRFFIVICAAFDQFRCSGHRATCPGDTQRIPWQCQLLTPGLRPEVYRLYHLAVRVVHSVEHSGSLLLGSEQVAGRLFFLLCIAALFQIARIDVPEKDEKH